ncbi:unnamed protein product [Gordionus sp. m RMFG-2023]
MKRYPHHFLFQSFCSLILLLNIVATVSAIPVPTIYQTENTISETSAIPNMGDTYPSDVTESTIPPQMVTFTTYVKKPYENNIMHPGYDIGYVPIKPLPSQVYQTKILYHPPDFYSAEQDYGQNAPFDINRYLNDVSYHHSKPNSYIPPPISPHIYDKIQEKPYYPNNPRYAGQSRHFPQYPRSNPQYLPYHR